MTKEKLMQEINKYGTMDFSLGERLFSIDKDDKFRVYEIRFSDCPSDPNIDVFYDTIDELLECYLINGKPLIAYMCDIEKSKHIPCG